MNRFLKILAGLLLAAFLGFVGLSVLREHYGVDFFDKSGWSVEEDGTTRYLNYNGDPLTDWQNIEGNWYYFDSYQDGRLVTGWVELSEKRYYLDPSGVRVTGWLELDGSRYYLDPATGAAATGWFTADEGTYYMDPATGAMATGWTDVGANRYYLDEATGLLAEGWLQLDGALYYLAPGTGAMATGLTEIEGNTYYLDATGALYTGWLETAEGIRYLDETTGIMVTGWLEDEELRQYFDENGLLASGWTQIDGETYYLSATGTPCTGWLDWEEERYYLDEDGLLCLGWLEVEDVLYYFQEDGSMAIGKVIIDGTASYFSSTGAYVVLVNKWNPVPDSYQTELVSFKSWKVSSDCYDALVQMLSDCPYSYSINSAYRSKESQQAIWNTRLERYRNQGYSQAGALAMVRKYVAEPGYSEHQLGLAIDISGSNAICAWLAEHCWEYGFVLRYPEGKSEITGIAYERWHFRYLGTELAAELTELGLTLEEYMDMLTLEQGSDAGTASDPELFTQAVSGSAE